MIWNWILSKIDYYFGTSLSDSDLNLFRILIMLWLAILFCHIFISFVIFFRARAKRNLLRKLKCQLKINITKNDASLNLSKRICARQKAQKLNDHDTMETTLFEDSYGITEITHISDWSLSEDEDDNENDDDDDDYDESNSENENENYTSVAFINLNRRRRYNDKTNRKGKTRTTRSTTKKGSKRKTNKHEIYGVCTRLHNTTNDLHCGELLVVLQRWLNLSYLRINDELFQIKYLLLCLQKYILPFSIAICILLDPNSGASNRSSSDSSSNNDSSNSDNNTGDNDDKWYAYASILIYYLHLHLLYEIFHHKRYFLKALARVTLFWGIFVSVIAAIVSQSNSNGTRRGGKTTSDNHDSDDDITSHSIEHDSDSDDSIISEKDESINFYESLAGLLVFGIFVITFDLCWVFYLKNKKTKLRLIFFVILVNCCYFGTFLYLLENDLIWINNEPIVHYTGFCGYLDTPNASSNVNVGRKQNISDSDTVMIDITCYVYIVVILLFLIALLHCQIVFNQVIDIVVYGSVEQYLRSPIVELEELDQYDLNLQNEKNSHCSCCGCCRRKGRCRVLRYLFRVYWNSLFSMTKVDKMYGPL